MPDLKPILDTPWTAEVSRTLPHNEYPRPQMVRKSWSNLNGPWEFTMAPGDSKPASFGEKILVPFAPESYLSGVMKPVPEGSSLWYRRTFMRPTGERVLLHFEALDWECRVWVDGTEVGSHKGGFDPFSFDVTSALKGTGEHEVIVMAKDPTDGGPQPRGKQVRKPEGIWYTPTSGIWGTVWAEGVPKDSIRDIKLKPKNDGTLAISVERWGTGNGQDVTVEVRDGNQLVATGKGANSLQLKVPNPQLWSPDSPKLYSVKVDLASGDSVESYVGFREVGLGKDEKGRTRLVLNGKPVFQVGPLDQGFWPDGLFTPPTYEAMIYDVDVTKRLGFNLIRKHVKIEPRTWYAYCDKVGMLVWQDMPSGDQYIGANDPDSQRTPESKEIFEREYKAMVNNLENHPSIVAWVLFNEGWGQFDTQNMSKWAKDVDPERILVAVTGWADRGTGDVHDWHVYPGPGSPKPEANRAATLGEYGGLGLPIPGHMWQKENWGYRTYKNSAELTDAFVKLMTETHLLIGDPGLSAAVYTQTTDVETETNGLMTYDRRELKMDEAKIRKAITDLFTTPPVLEEIVPTSQMTPQAYRFTTEAPAEGWEKPGFNDSAWKTGQGGFGKGAPNTSPRTEWTTPDIWLRREIEIADDVDGKDLVLSIYHDDAAELFVDGVSVAKLEGYSTQYQRGPLLIDHLSKGKHTIAIHCHQNAGGQYIDFGMYRLKKG